MQDRAVATGVVCPVNGDPICDRLATSHRMTVLSELPEARSFESGLKATLVTQFS